MSSAPPLSIVLLNHNGGSHLQPCLESIWVQRLVSPQLVVVDRGSTDASRAWLESHAGRLSTVLLEDNISLHAAANRGIAAASGEWLLFLRPQDRLVGDLILSECLNWMRKTEAGVVAGEVACNDGRILKLNSHPNAIAQNFVPDSGTFYRRTLFAENGEFDLTLSAMAAYDFHLRLWKSRVRFKPIPLRVVASDRSRVPLTWASAREEMRVRHRYFSAGRSLGADFKTMLRCIAGRE